jgi:homogentisate 1,2-dioxygenase
MPFYNCQGNIPSKRHIVFKNNDNNIYYEELVSREGFSGISSNLYHINRPTSIKKVGEIESKILNNAAKNHRPRHINTSSIDSKEDIIKSKKELFFNNDVIISVSRCNNGMDYFYRNGIGDELLYIQSGTGTLNTNLGKLLFNPGDYIVIPKGTIWKLTPNKEIRVLMIETAGQIATPSRYRNQFGQLLEHSPYCERDMKTPTLQDPKDIKGDFLIKLKSPLGIQNLYYGHHPFDVVGWDGYYYPWIFNIHNFEPIVGQIHQPPPVHQTFQAQGIVICSFVPRLFDFHPKSIPAPYPHSNIDSDEIIYYSKGDFMSRKGIQKESITLHPMGMPHGPQPGKYRGSIGKNKTDELAVMVDTFRPLNITKNAITLDDKNYPFSWVD